MVGLKTKSEAGVCKSGESVYRDFVLCTTACTPKPPFWSGLPWWPHLMNISWKWSILVQKEVRRRRSSQPEVYCLNVLQNTGPGSWVSFVCCPLICQGHPDPCRGQQKACQVIVLWTKHTKCPWADRNKKLGGGGNWERDWGRGGGEFREFPRLSWQNFPTTVAPQRILGIISQAVLATLPNYCCKSENAGGNFPGCLGKTS